MKFRHSLIYASCLFFIATGFAHAAVLVAVDDNFGIPADGFLQVESPGVLQNDTLDGQSAADNNGVTAVLVSSVANGTLSCPTNPGVELCTDGSFEYTPDPGFSGTDSFTYQAAFGVDVSASATVTLSACSGGPTIFTCWHETPYRAKLSELGYSNLFLESFEGTAWDAARSPTAVQSVVSKDITWTTNHPATNNITTGPGPARTGLWGGYDPDHGFATETDPTICDVDVVPIECRPHDGLSGKILPGGVKLHGVGGYISGFTNASIAIILDGTSYNVGKLPDAGFHFFGVIDTAGFDGFEFQEQGGKSGQELLIFGDDFLIATSGAVPVNNPPVLALLDERSVPPEPVVSPLTVNENEWLSILLTATDPDDGDSWSFSMSAMPAGASFDDNFDGTATFSWRPTFDQAGSYPLTFTVTDNGIPVESASESITITVNDAVPPAGDLRFSTSNYSVAENGVSKTITVTRVNGSFGTVGVDFDTGDNTATAGSDYTATSGSLSFADGILSQTFTVTILDDSIYEGNESLSLSLSNPTGGAGLALPVTASLTIIENDSSADVTPPVISLVGVTPVSIELGSTYVDDGATALDNIDGDITTNIVPTSTVNTNVVGAYTVTYNVSDAAGNPAAPVVRTVSVTADVTKPVVTAPANILIAATDANGTAASVAAIASFLNAATATDNVDTTLTITNDAPLTFPLGDTIVTFSATDTAGNTGTAQATVTVSDQTKPVISLIGAATLSIEQGSIYNDAGATATDNVDGNLTTSIVTVNNVNTAIAGTYTVTYNVSDAATNAAVEVVRTVTVTADATAPVVTAPANIVVAATDASGTAASDPVISSFLGGAGATDNVDATLTISNNAPLTFPLGDTIVTFSAADTAGNTGTAQATVTVSDQTKPVISLIGAAALSIEQGSIYNDAGATATDNVDGNLTTSIVTVNNVNAALAGIYTVTYNVSDTATNAAVEVVRTVTVTADATAPLVTAPANILVAATNASGTAASNPAINGFLSGASATDNVDVTLTITNNAPATFPLGGTLVTFSATDTAGNTGTAQATVTVSDQTKPVITLLGANSITINVGETFADPGATASDNVDGNITMNILPGGTVDAGTVGLYTLTYNVSDAAGNAADQVTRSVSVQDGSAPVVTAPANITVAATDANGTAATDAAIALFLSSASAIDTVDGVINTISHDAPPVFPLGSTIVTFSATDTANNTGQAQATVTVSDQTKPVISLIGAATLSIEQGSLYNDAGATAADNVDGNLTTSIVTVNNVNTAIAGIYTVTYNVSDAATNAAIEVVRTVTVTADAIAPVVTVPANILVAATDASGTAASDPAINGFLSGASATDNIDVTLTISNNAPPVFPLGNTTVTFSATDTAGNTGTAQATLTVSDQTKPVISLLGAATLNIEQGSLYNDDGATASDNVDGNLTTSIVTLNNVNTAVEGIYTVTYNVSDAATNAAVEVVRTVTVTADATSPVVTAPANIVVAATDASGTAASDPVISSFLAGASATDNIDATLTITNNAPVTFSLGATIVTFSTTDTAGNTGTDQATVTVSDQGIPVISLIGDAIVNVEQGSLYNDAGATASDNIDGDITASIKVSSNVNINLVGSYSVIYNVIDNAGNPAAPAVRTVNVTAAPAGSLQFSAPVYTVAENGTSVIITVTRVGGSFGTVSVDYSSIAGGSAVSGGDYIAVAGTLSFADAEISQTFSIDIIDDANYEGDETVNLLLSNASSASLGTPSSAVLTITEDEPVPSSGSLQFSAPIYSENENGITAIITVTRIGGSFGTVGVDYASADGSAMAGSDYTAVAGSLSFADGEISQTFSVDIIDDADYEGDETLNLTLSNPTGGAGLGSPVLAVLTISEDEPVPPSGSLQFSAPIYSENENGISAIIAVTRIGGSFGTVGVDYASADGSAMAGSDYTAVIGSLSFADGVVSQTFSIDIIDDADYEGDETLNLTLSNPTGGAGLGSPVLAVLTISEDEPVPPSGSLQFSATDYSIAEDGITATITVTRIGGSFGTVGVDYASADGSAMAGSDYTAVIGSLSFADGEMSQTFSIDIIDDADYEGDESLNVILSNPTGGAGLGSPALAIITILENEPVPPTGSLQFSAATYSVAENIASATITVTRVGGSFGTVGVSYATSDGPAKAGSDYTATSGNLSFAEGILSQTFNVTILDDTTYEGDEALKLTLSNPTGGAGLIKPNVAALIILENDPFSDTRVEPNDNNNGAGGGGGGSSSMDLITLILLISLYRLNLRSKSYGLYHLSR